MEKACINNCILYNNKRGSLLCINFVGFVVMNHMQTELSAKNVRGYGMIKEIIIANNWISNNET